MTYKEFKKRLEEAKTEETVKSIYAKYFNIKYNTADKHDLYTPKVLFEFKFDKNFVNLKALSTILAQTLYYIRRLKYEDVEKKIPYYLCLADKNESVITETNKWSTLYSSDVYDWERPPSKPDPKLIDHIVKEPETQKLHIYKVTNKAEHDVYHKLLKSCLNPQMLFDFADKKVINEENFEAVYEHWREVIGLYIINGYKESYYFLSNIQRERIIIDKESSRIVFTFEDKNSKAQKVLMHDYEYFWNLYYYVEDLQTIKGIHAKLDRLTDETQRRFEGEFYTPLRFAKKAIRCFGDVLEKDWYKSGKYRIWDMAAGTGNLEYNLPAESYKYLYMSTLHSSEVDHLKKVFPDATSFQYDYLNDDVEYLFDADKLPFEPNWKLPKKLRDELADDSITWIVYINPPFATAQVGGAKGESKKGVSKTKIEILMDGENVGHAKRELFAQFMYRISTKMPRKTYLGMFSKLKYLNAPDSIAYRDQHFNYQYEKGFLFKSTTFHGVKGKYPIGFLIWNLNKERSLRNIDIDICNDDGKAIGTKHLRLLERKDVLNNWFERPQNSNDYILPPLSNGITVREGNADTRHRARKDFLASICSKGNDFQNSKYVVILSSPSVSAGAFTVNEDNFDKALMLHAVKKIPKPTWLNDRNQFLIPSQEPDEEFTTDCIVWSLFANSNETTSLKDVQYQNNIYQIKNNFYPFLINTLQNWDIKDPDFKLQMLNDEDRFVSKWLQNKHLSEESKQVLEKGEEIYKIFYANLNIMATHNLKISSWDVGWYQLRRCLAEHGIGFEEIEELKNMTQRLAEKILPKIYEYGFLDKDEVYEKI